jgi:hypothetical protein
VDDTNGPDVVLAPDEQVQQLAGPLVRCCHCLGFPGDALPAQAPPEHDPNTTRTEASPARGNVGLMHTDTRRTTGLKRSSTALGAALLVLGSLALGACSKTDATGTADSAMGAAPVQEAAATDRDTIDLVSTAVDTPAVDDPAVDTPAVDDPAQGADSGAADRRGLRARMLRALHGTWVTQGSSGPVTHQAIRGDVTAVSATSVTVKARDGFTQTFAVAPDTKVRARSNGKGADSAIGAVTVGSKALVTGVGATNPTARVVVFKVTTSRPGGSPSPSATS